MVHGATTGWIPTSARGVDLQGAVINTGVAWVTAATGILVFLKAQNGAITSTLYCFSHSHNLSIIFATDSFVYRLSLLNFVYNRHLFTLFIVW